MNPFDYPIGDRERSLHDGYRTMWECRKVGYENTSNYVAVNGTAWVDLPFPLDLMSPHLFDVSMYEIKLATGGAGWTGNPMYRILINGQKVYPFDDVGVDPYGNWDSFGSMSMNIRPGEVCTVDGRSKNAADTTGQTMACTVRLVNWEHRG